MNLVLKKKKAMFDESFRAVACNSCSERAHRPNPAPTRSNPNLIESWQGSGLSGHGGLAPTTSRT